MSSWRVNQGVGHGTEAIIIPHEENGVVGIRETCRERQERKCNGVVVGARSEANVETVATQKRRCIDFVHNSDRHALNRVGREQERGDDEHRGRCN